MKTHTMEFHNEEDGTLIKMVIGAGDTELNEFFRAATMAYIQPHILAMQLGRLSEEREREILMQAYACGVVLDSEPKMSEQEVLAWFKSHPQEFDILFEIADYRKNFEDDDHPNEHGGNAASPGTGGEGAG